MSRLLITNAYNARNRGDAAIILGMIETFRRTETFRDATVVVSSAGYPEDCAHYPVPVVPSFVSIQRELPGGRRWGRLYFLCCLLPLSCLWALSRRWIGWTFPVPYGLRSVLAEYDAADLIVAAGGGYLYTTSLLRGNVVLLMHLYTFLFGSLLGKPVYLYAQSVGPFRGRLQARLVRAALNRARLVEARESLTRELLDGWALRTPVCEAVDAAFLLSPRSPAEGLVPAFTGRLRIGVTVRSWYRSPARQRVYEETMAAFLDRLVSDLNAAVVFLPQVTVTDLGDDDRCVARRTVVRMRLNRWSYVVEDELAADVVKFLCGSMDFFVGTRMHSNIFALSLEVPTLAVAYQPKTRGIMDQLGLSEFVVPIDELSVERLTATFHRLRREKARIRDQLAAVLPTMQDRAAGSGRLIAESFDSSGINAATGVRRAT